MVAQVLHLSVFYRLMQTRDRDGSTTGNGDRYPTGNSHSATRTSLQMKTKCSNVHWGYLTMRKPSSLWSTSLNQISFGENLKYVRQEIYACRPCTLKCQFFKELLNRLKNPDTLPLYRAEGTEKPCDIELSNPKPQGIASSESKIMDLCSSDTRSWSRRTGNLYLLHLRAALIEPKLQRSLTTSKHQAPSPKQKFRLVLEHWVTRVRNKCFISRYRAIFRTGWTQSPQKQSSTYWNFGRSRLSFIKTKWASSISFLWPWSRSSSPT